LAGEVTDSPQQSRAYFYKQMKRGRRGVRKIHCPTVPNWRHPANTTRCFQISDRDNMWRRDDPHASVSTTVVCPNNPTTGIAGFRPVIASTELHISLSADGESTWPFPPSTHILPLKATAVCCHPLAIAPANRRTSHGGYGTQALATGPRVSVIEIAACAYA